MSDKQQFGGGDRPQVQDLSEQRLHNWVAEAVARIRMRAETLASVVSGQIAAGDVLSAAAIGGALGAKQAHCIVPLHHQSGLTHARIEFGIDSLRSAIDIVATVKGPAAAPPATEALAGAFAAALTIFDMLAAVDADIIIEDVRLTSSYPAEVPAEAADREAPPAEQAPVSAAPPRLRVVTPGLSVAALPKRKPEGKRKSKDSAKAKRASPKKRKPKAKGRSKKLVAARHASPAKRKAKRKSKNLAGARHASPAKRKTKAKTKAKSKKASKRQAKTKRRTRG